MTPLPPPSPWALLRALPTLGRRGSGELRDLASEWQSGPVPAAQWKAFAEALGYPRADEPPLCFHYLGLQRAQLEQMLAPAFPYPLPGMVHLAQTLTRAAPWQDGAPWHLVQSVAPLEGRGGAQHLRWQAEWRQDGHEVLRAESLYLARRAPLGGSRPAARAPTAPEGTAIADWVLSAATGRHYARLSGDWNPIHLWAWSARLLGQRRPLIHGMHSAARCEAELTRHRGRPLQSLSIRFTRPLALPGHAVLWCQGQTFSLLDGTGQTVARGEFA